MKHEQACECGSAIKLHGLDGDPSIDEARAVWERRHHGPGHDRVANAEATRIRDLQRQAIKHHRPTWTPRWPELEETH